MPHRHCVSAETLVWISPRHIRWQTNLELEMVSVPEDSLFIVLLQRSKNWLNYKCYSRQTAVKSSHYVVTLQILHWPNTAEETIYKYFWILKYIYRKYFTLLPVKAWCIHYDELPQGTVMKWRKFYLGGKENTLCLLVFNRKRNAAVWMFGNLDVWAKHRWSSLIFMSGPFLHCPPHSTAIT